MMCTRGQAVQGRGPDAWGRPPPERKRGPWALRPRLARRAFRHSREEEPTARSPAEPARDLSSRAHTSGHTSIIQPEPRQSPSAGATGRETPPHTVSHR